MASAATTISRRAVPLGDVEFRDEGDRLVFRGHAAVFDEETDLGWFRERVAPGAFRKTIVDARSAGPGSQRDIAFLYNHDADSVMARVSNGSLRLAEDSVGLAVEADLDQADTDVMRMVPKLKAGNVAKMSFAFRTIKDEWDEADPRSPLRTLNEVQLFDVSPVTFPAYDGTDGGLREARDRYEAARSESGAIATVKLQLDTSDFERSLSEAVELMEQAPGSRRALTPDEAKQAREYVAGLLRLLDADEPVSEPEPHSDERHSLSVAAARRRLAVIKARVLAA